MANEIRVRQNFIGGLIEDNPLSAVATTLTSVSLAALPVIGSTQHMPIILDPDGVFGEPEIAWVTAHTNGATTATILRGQEVTTARAHTRDTPWLHGPLASDMLGTTGTERLGTGTTVTATDWQANGNASISTGVGTATNAGSQSGSIVSKSAFTLIDGMCLKATIVGGGASGSSSADGWSFGLIDAAQAATLNSSQNGPNGLYVWAVTYQTYSITAVSKAGGTNNPNPNIVAGQYPVGGVFNDPQLWRTQEIELRYFQSRRAGYWDLEFWRDRTRLYTWSEPFVAPAAGVRAYLQSYTGGVPGTVSITSPSLVSPGA